MRILHLVDPGSPGGGPCTLRLAAEAVARIGGAHHDVVIVGHAGHLDTARRCGLVPRGGVGAPLNDPMLAGGALRAMVGSLVRVGGRYDVIHGWTPTAAAAACRAAGPARVLATAVDVAAAETPAAWWLAHRGVPLAVIGAGIDPAVLAPERRPLLRAAWGADETTFLVGLLGEPAGGCDGEFALDATGRPRLTGRDIRLVMHHGAMPVSGLRRWLGRLGLAELVIIDDRIAEPWQVLPGLDAALYATPSRPRVRPAGLLWRAAGRVMPLRRSGAAAPGTGPLLWAMAAGTPVMTQDTPAGRELVADGVTGLLFAQGDFHWAGARLLDLFSQPRTAQRLGAAACGMIGARYAPGPFAARLEAAYGQVSRGRPRGDGGPAVIETLAQRPAAPAVYSGSSSADAASW